MRPAHNQPGKSPWHTRTVRTTEAGSVITAYVFNSSHVLSDLGGGVTIRVSGM